MRISDLSSDGCSSDLATATLKIGNRLVRDWPGKPHQVLIRDDGFVYQDRVYRSLSHISRAITGSNWSGPRFFGLARRQRKLGSASGRESVSQTCRTRWLTDH